MNEKIGYKDIFKQKEYFKMIIAALINRFGDSIDAIASTWIVYEITGNAAWSAIIFALNKIPTVLITPFAGAWVEGKNKKIIMIVTDIIRAICVAIVATGYLMQFLRPWMLMVTTFVISTSEAFRGPANIAMTPKILEEKYYEYGMSLMSSLSTIVEIIGTAIAASIIALIGTAGAIYIDMVTFLLSAIIIMTINSREKTVQKQKVSVKQYLSTFKEGLLYVKNEKIVMFFIFLAVFLNAILVPLNSLQAPLANEILHGGAEVLSILGIVLMIGMMAGSVFYPMVCTRIKPKTIMFVGGVGIGVYYLSLVLCIPFYENKWFMYVFVTIASILFGFLVAILNSFMQVEFMKRIEETYLARAASVMTALGSAATPIVGFVISAIAVFAKTEWIFMFAGILDVVVCILMFGSKVLDGEIEQKEVLLDSVIAE